MQYLFLEHGKKLSTSILDTENILQELSDILQLVREYGGKDNIWEKITDIVSRINIVSNSLANMNISNTFEDIKIDSCTGVFAALFVVNTMKSNISRIDNIITNIDKLFNSITIYEMQSYDTECADTYITTMRNSLISLRPEVYIFKAINQSILGTINTPVDYKKNMLTIELASRIEGIRLKASL